jgi:tetratricopeptide (TPR) repeat protein
LLADIYGGLGSLCTNSNQFQGAFDNFNKQLEYVQLAISHGELERPTIWEVFGLGRLGNGLNGLHRYKEAEEHYRKCLDIWKELPGDRRIFVSNLATCLWLQGELDEGERLLRDIIKDRNDTSSLR